MVLGSTQPPTEMSTRNISWGRKGGQCVGLTTLPHSCANCLEICEPQPTRTLRACPGIVLFLTVTYKLAAPDAHARLKQTTKFAAAVTPDMLMLQQLSANFTSCISLCYSYNLSQLRRCHETANKDQTNGVCVCLPTASR